MKDITQLKSKIEKYIGDKLTVDQLWCLVLLSKHVRLRCRNNVAFNNFMNSMFPYARFRVVQKTKINKYTGKEEKYDGLRIDVENQQSEIENEDNED